MSKQISLVFFFTLVVNFAGEAQAVGNADAGRNKAAPCASCHGSDGNSLAPLFPRLASQHTRYLVSQLTAFKTENRRNETMQSISASLSTQDMENISAFYRRQKPVISNEEEQYLDEDEEIPVSDDLIHTGRKLYRGGNIDTGVSACIACHGPQGLGNESAGFPVIQGQFAAYVAKSLNDFKSGEREDQASMMTLITEKMTSDEINAVSAYISSMR